MPDVTRSATATMDEEADVPHTRLCGGPGPGALVVITETNTGFAVDSTFYFMIS